MTSSATRAEHTSCAADRAADRAAVVYLDFCFYEFCNFTCTYCRDTNRDMSRGTSRSDFDQAILDFLERHSAAVLKLSGYGEVTLWLDVVDAVRMWAPSFPSVQVITNGAGPPAVYEALSEIPNFTAAVTLDGHTSESDRFRTKGVAAVHRRVLDSIDLFVSRDVPLEVNCVISRANVADFDRYLHWCLDTLGDRAMVIPFPVRATLGQEAAEVKESLYPTVEQIEHFAEVVVDRHSEFSHVLAPLAYTEALIKFMLAERRLTSCHIHRANFGVNTKLAALACACAGDRLIQPLGPIAAVGVDPAIERRRRRYIELGNVGAKCSGCFTHYDIVNLFLTGAISEAEMARVPSLSAPESLRHLTAVRGELAEAGVLEVRAESILPPHETT